MNIQVNRSLISAGAGAKTTRGTNLGKRFKQVLHGTKQGTAKQGTVSNSDRLLGRLNSLELGRLQVDRVMKEALSGRRFNPGELLALQAGIYRLNTELELAAKVVESSNAAVKRTLSTEV
ncbi:MAG: hypothetical protein GXP49_10995 [Deltaproteobacteria bacterium]|nr:hypothetical protein [Deltaproteobacteria bacterium]